MTDSQIETLKDLEAITWADDLHVAAVEEPTDSLAATPIYKNMASCIIAMYNEHPVTKAEMTEDKQAWKLTCKLRTYNKDEDLTNEEYVNSLKDWNLYISTYDESYIGSDKRWEALSKRGFVMYQSYDKGSTASVAYCPSENKWYGWSHRAMYGFTIGDVVSEGDITATSGLIEEYEIQHPEENLSLPVGYKATTMKKAKRMAIAFASAVA
jgi:hypothetical protein